MAVLDGGQGGTRVVVGRPADAVGEAGRLGVGRPLPEVGVAGKKYTPVAVVVDLRRYVGAGARHRLAAVRARRTGWEEVGERGCQLLGKRGVWCRQVNADRAGAVVRADPCGE